MKSALLAVSASLVVATAAPAFAEPIDDAIAARRGYFKLVLANFGPLVGMAKGQVDFDADAAALYATNLDALSSMDLWVVLPEGSDNGAKAGDTRALPAIWADGDGFEEKYEGFATAIDDLVAVSGSLDSLRGAIGAVGGSCGACHKEYRAENF